MARNGSKGVRNGTATQALLAALRLPAFAPDGAQPGSGMKWAKAVARVHTVPCWATSSVLK